MFEAPQEKILDTSETEFSVSRLASGRKKYWTLAVLKQLPKSEFWCDSACDRGVSGPAAHRGIREVLVIYGIKPLKETISEKFIFGDGETKTSRFRYVYPVVLGGKYRGKLGQACIDEPCPLLLSHPVMKNWKVHLDFENQHTTVKKFNHSLSFSSGVPTVDICDFGPLDKFDLMKSGIPSEFWIDPSGKIPSRPE